MKKKISLQNIPPRTLLLVLVPILAAIALLAVFSILPKADWYLAEGSVEIASISCFAQVSGAVESVPVQTGQPIGKGDVLAVIDDSAVDEKIAQLRQTMKIQEAQLRQLKTPANAEALLASRQAAQSTAALWEETLAQAQRAVVTAQQKLDDQQLLYEAGAIAKLELQQQERELEAAQSQVVIAQAQLSAARSNVEAIQLPEANDQAVAAAQAEMDLTQLQIDQLETSREKYNIRAASDGVVISSALEPGATVIAGQSAFRLSNGALQYFVFYLPQDYLSQLSFGDELVLFRQGSQEEAARGTVSYIDWEAVYPPDNYETDGNRNQRSVKIKVELKSGGSFAVGQALFLRLEAVQD